MNLAIGPKPESPIESLLGHFVLLQKLQHCSTSAPEAKLGHRVACSGYFPVKP